MLNFLGAECSGREVGKRANLPECELKDMLIHRWGQLDKSTGELEGSL